MRLIRKNINKFVSEAINRAYTLKEVSGMLATYNDLVILNEVDTEITKDVMIELAFKKKDEMKDFLEYTIDNDTLVDILLSGGAENWLARKRRGF